MTTFVAASALALSLTVTLAWPQAQATPPAGAPKSAPAPAAQNQLTQAERDSGWVLLFDGTNAGTSLRGYRKGEVGDAWKVEDGCIVLRGQGGDLVTKDQYENFDFTVDWNVAEGGNSGVMYRVTEDCNYPWETGPEMQILDDARHVDGKDRLTSAGACYALYAAPEGVVKPAGQWNTARIVAVGPKMTYFLNGTKVVEFDMTSDDYKARVAKSKFAKMPNYGTRTKGHIALQDHGDVIKFRNIKVRTLDKDGKPVMPTAAAKSDKPAAGDAGKTEAPKAGGASNG